MGKTYLFRSVAEVAGCVNEARQRQKKYMRSLCLNDPLTFPDAPRPTEAVRPRRCIHVIRDDAYVPHAEWIQLLIHGDIPIWLVPDVRDVERVHVDVILV